MLGSGPHKPVGVGVRSPMLADTAWTLKHHKPVIPAQAGIQRTLDTLHIFNGVWIPSFAGMTMEGGCGHYGAGMVGAPFSTGPRYRTNGAVALDARVRARANRWKGCIDGLGVKGGARHVSFAGGYCLDECITVITVICAASTMR